MSAAAADLVLKVTEADCLQDAHRALLRAVSAYAAVTTVMAMYWTSIAIAPQAWVELRFVADILLAFLAIFLFVGEGWSSLAAHRSEWRRQLIALAAGLAVGFILDRLAAACMPTLVEGEDGLKETVGMPIVVIEYVLFAGIFEESLFRGYILRRLLVGANPTRSVALQGILFGLYHFNGYLVLWLAIAGMFLGVITLFSRSVWPAIFLHAAWNYFASI